MVYVYRTYTFPNGISSFGCGYKFPLVGKNFEGYDVWYNVSSLFHDFKFVRWDGVNYHVSNEKPV